MRNKTTVVGEFKPTKGQETRIRIIETATELFMSEGLYKVTFGQIAQRVRLSQPAIYKYFNDMDDLFLESCKHWVGLSNQYINERSDGLDSAKFELKQYLERHLVYAAKNRSHDALLFGVYYYALHSPKMLVLYKQVKEAGLLKITRILNLGNRDGSWKISDPELVAETIHSLVVGEVIKVLVEPKRELTHTRLNRVYQIINSLLQIRLSN